MKNDREIYFMFTFQLIKQMTFYTLEVGESSSY